MRIIERFKRDVTKHPARASVLVVLSVLMIAMMVRAVFELQPKTAAASSASTLGSPVKASTIAVDETESMDRINGSLKLWPLLRKVEGVPAALAFTFDASYYTPDPSRKVVQVLPEPEAPKVVAVAPVVDNTEAVRRAKELRIREQSRTLVVQFTTLGNGSAPPQAVVNNKMLGVGDEISGFEIAAIRAREVEFNKDGVTVAVKMAGDPRGQ